MKYPLRLVSVLFSILIVLFCLTPLMAEGATIIDNGDPETRSTGAWRISGGTSPYGGNSLWSRNGASYTWTFNPSVSGVYDLAMWWSAWSSRSTSVPVSIETADGLASVTVNQLQDAEQWFSLGQYAFAAGGTYDVTIIAQPGPSSTCADAVSFTLLADNASPQAFIDNILPNPAGTEDVINFQGHGTDSDGSIAGYEWRSDVDGLLGTSATISTTLSVGRHTVTFIVVDDAGQVSAADTRIVDVVGTGGEDVIIDNGDIETQSTGGWSLSGGADPYGSESLWSRNGATYTWTFTPNAGGLYALSMWWTSWPSRSTNVPVNITTETGIVRKYINQQQNGGQWVNLGQYLYSAGESYEVTVTAQPGPSSTCADAVRFSSLGNNLPPIAAIDALSPNPALPSEIVTFNGSGNDSDGSIAAYSWRSDIDGFLSDQDQFNLQDLSFALTEGIHTIYFSVQDDGGVWSPEVAQTLVFRGCDNPIRIMPLGDSITLDTFTGDPRPIGARTGYRQPLWTRLISNGHYFDFVGGISAGQTAVPMFDPGNEGHPGWSDAQLVDGRPSDPQAGRLSQWLVDHQPDIILLHIGTNDLEADVTDIERILNTVDAYSPETIVVLARIINRNVYSQTTTDFNANIGAMAADRIAAGDKVMVVDMENDAGINYELESVGGDMVDDLHPNANGYNKMAAVWDASLWEVMPSCNAYPPLIYTEPFDQAASGDIYQYQIGAIGLPAPSFALQTSPAGMTIDNITGTLSWTPDLQQTGTHVVEVVAQNSEGSATQQFTLNVSTTLQVQGAVGAGSGTITCDPEYPLEGQTATCLIAPADGYLLGQLRDNGIDVTAQVSDEAYVLDNITADHLVEVDFIEGTVIDNRDGETTYTGAWYVSGGSLPYDADSIYSRDGATYTWLFTPLSSGSYAISMWWTEWPSRSDQVAVSIQHTGGIENIVVNQQIGGGRFNSLRTLNFQAGVTYSVTLTASPGPSSTCADAVRFVKQNAS